MHLMPPVDLRSPTYSPPSCLLTQIPSGPTRQSGDPIVSLACHYTAIMQGSADSSHTCSDTVEQTVSKAASVQDGEYSGLSLIYPRFRRHLEKLADDRGL